MNDKSSGPYSKNSAVLLWFAWIFGFGGVHRIYLGKPVTGVLYLLTWGLFGVGQVLDLVRLGGMVERANAKELRAGRGPHGLLAKQNSIGLLPQGPTGDPEELARLKLLAAAAKHGNALSVTQGVMATGKTFKEVEKLLDQMAKSGYVGIDNDPTTGAVVYTFGELS
ncbi:MAG: TM2 domain-containing protein [Myxococcales bacterium]|nr:TM2 domain-containing protein [Myxococcales bacterium]